uniref:Uncharacterized protein n=1 Tax=Glossina pallidipes TaxID=7398 RepID=A0A1A9ZV56_GLOPL
MGEEFLRNTGKLLYFKLLLCSILCFVIFKRHLRTRISDPVLALKLWSSCSNSIVCRPISCTNDMLSNLDALEVSKLKITSPIAAALKILQESLKCEPVDLAKHCDNEVKKPSLHFYSDVL